MIRSGATQWRHDCTCAEARQSQPWERMHSEVSRANAQYFVEGDRVGDAVTEADLYDFLDRHDHAIVCNVCGTIKGLGGEWS